MIVRSGARTDLAALLEERHPGARVAVIADTNVAAVLGSPLGSALLFAFPAGEANKSRATWAELTDRLLASRFDRHSVVVAFGGGVTTDLAGFVAATLLRGVPWIAVPTTTLAMLDAAIGGKTGVDTTAGKNLVGAFHPPSAVICDPAVLSTLPDRCYREGLAEAAGQACRDTRRPLWRMDGSACCGHRPQRPRRSSRHPPSVEIKADVVTEDEREGDRRGQLNAGHTVAHALERATDYAIRRGGGDRPGTRDAGRRANGVVRAGTADRIVALLAALGLPTTPPHRRRPPAIRGSQSACGQEESRTAKATRP